MTLKEYADEINKLAKINPGLIVIRQHGDKFDFIESSSGLKLTPIGHYDIENRSFTHGYYCSEEFEMNAIIL